MKNKLQSLLGFVLLLSCPEIMAQQTISGRIRNAEGRKVEGAIVTLLRAKDSALLKTGSTEDNGAFELTTTASGSLFLQYTAPGYDTRYSQMFNLDAGQHFTAPEAIMERASKKLGSVNVTARKPMVQVKPDRTVFNVQNSISATGSNGLELLHKSPGVVVDNNENITMKGKTGVKVYVDGKLVQLNGEELAAYLKGLNSHDIETIEIITSPDASFDASGSAGVINLKLKKNQQQGANASITGGFIQGLTPKGNGAFNANYRSRKVNLYGNITTAIGRHQKDIIAPRSQKDTTYDQRLLQINRTSQFNIKAGLDYFLNNRSTIGVVNTTGYTEDDYTSEGHTAISYDPTGVHVKSLVASNHIPRRRTNSSTNLNYRYADTTGREINIDLNKGLYRGRAESYQPNYYVDKDGRPLSQIITYNNTPTDIDIHTAKIDLSLNAGKTRLSFGAKYAAVRTDNTLDFYNEENGIKRKVTDRSYQFVYREKVSAAYLSLSRQLRGKWQVNLGVRAEHTESEGILTREDGMVQADHQVRRTYLDLFPNAGIGWAVNPDNQFNLAYSRRIDRPNYQVLNPFEMKLDELSYVKGNAFLKPQYTDHIELSYTWKNRLNLTAGYSHVKDLATQTVDTFRNYTYAYAKNIASQHISSINASTPVTINRWWNLFLNGWFNIQLYKGSVNGEMVELRATAYGLFLQQNFLLGKDYVAEVTAWYNGPAPLGPTLLGKSMGAVDIGLQKPVLKKRGTLRFSLTDVFKTAVPFRAGTNFGGLLLNFQVTRESRTAKLSFTYHFGNHKVKAARQRQSGLESESKRITESN